MGGKRCEDLRAWSNTWSRISRKGRAQRLRAEVDGLCERVAALDEPGADETPRVDAALPEDDLPAAMIENHTHTFTFTQSFTPRRIHGGGLEWRHTHGELEAHGGCRERYGSRVRDNDGRRAPTEIAARW